MDSLIGVEEGVQLVAPAAPIGAELEKNNFVFVFRSFESLLLISLAPSEIFCLVLTVLKLTISKLLCTSIEETII